MAGSMEQIQVNGLRARIARPAQAGKATKGGVLVLPTWMGPTDDTEQVCQSIAAAGLLALEWDPFSAYPEDTSRDDRWEISQKGSLLDENALREHVQWREYMQRELKLERIGVTGFCLGGRMSLSLAAKDPSIQACSVFYGTLWDPVRPHHLDGAALAADIRCPVQINHPGHDPTTTRATYAKLRRNLESRPGGIPLLWEHYPEAHHGFMGNAMQDDPFNRSAKAISWPIALAFFRACLA